ncbi:MAG: hypothetical protein I8H71_01320 [Xanthomonadaceae bacterium]|nr:hypothetical protein [Xanthomonadaceae bacterium]
MERLRGDLPRVAEDSGISYDTILRIKNRQNDPGYSKVRALHDYLFAAAKPRRPRPAPAEQGA